MKLPDFVEMLTDDLIKFEENMVELQSKGLVVTEIGRKEWMRTFLTWLEYETDMDAVYWGDS